MIISDSDSMKCGLIKESVHDYYRDKNIPCRIRCCGDWQELSRQVKEEKRRRYYRGTGWSEQAGRHHRVKDTIRQTGEVL